MYILICPVAVAQFIAVIYLCFETLSIITPTHPIYITTITGSSDGDCPSCLKDNIHGCRNLFCPAGFCGHEQVRYGDGVCSCWFLPLVLLPYEKTFLWS